VVGTQFTNAILKQWVTIFHSIVTSEHAGFRRKHREHRTTKPPQKGGSAPERPMIISAQHLFMKISGVLVLEHGLRGIRLLIQRDC
jgi:hypothetical protein